MGLSLNTLTRRFTELPNIIVMGDFNLPGINWLDGSGQVTSNPSYGVELNNVFLDQINDIGLNQLSIFRLETTTYLILYFLPHLPFWT